MMDKGEAKPDAAPLACLCSPKFFKFDIFLLSCVSLPHSDLSYMHMDFFPTLRRKNIYAPFVLNAYALLLRSFNIS